MKPSSQLALDLLAGASPSLDNFVAGPNRECLAAVRALAAGPAGGGDVRQIYLWGPPGGGKSHLARAVLARSPDGGEPLGPDAALRAFDAAGRQAGVFAVDDCDRLDGARQRALFALINRVRALPDARLLATGSAPPLGLALREDLRTRLGWGLVFELAPLADADKALALRALAGERGVMMSAEVVPYLLTHTSRDMRQLIGLFDALDRLALQRQKAITIPLVRELLQTSLNIE
ncbi:MAG: DnaA regulatory inactivator Hda [Burkholderiaceae bacterium]